MPLPSLRFKNNKHLSMLLLCIVAFISTTAFFRLAKCIGVHPGKAASIPFCACGVFLIIEYLVTCMIAEVALSFDVSNTTILWILFPMNLFFVLAYLALIRNNWTVLVLAANSRSVNYPKISHAERPLPSGSDSFSGYMG